MIVTVQIGESGTHGSPVTILGGWVGRLAQWVSFDPKWSGSYVAGMPYKHDCFGEQHDVAFWIEYRVRQL